MLVPIPTELREKMSFENGVPILEVGATDKEEKIFKKFVEDLKKEEAEKFDID